VCVLLQAGAAVAKVNQAVNQASKQHAAPLNIVYRSQHEAIALVLLQYDVDADAKDAWGESLRSIAASQGLTRVRLDAMKASGE